jgi:hypothetical protein
MKGLPTGFWRHFPGFLCRSRQWDGCILSAGALACGSPSGAPCERRRPSANAALGGLPKCARQHVPRRSQGGGGASREQPDPAFGPGDPDRVFAGAGRPPSGAPGMAAAVTHLPPERSRLLPGHQHVACGGFYLARLREKPEPKPADPGLIVTEPGVGYRFAERKGRSTTACLWGVFSHGKTTWVVPLPSHQSGIMALLLPDCGGKITGAIRRHPHFTRDERRPACR